MTQTFSIEAIVLGRNDNYEPNWLAKLYASIAYNRALFEGSNVDFRVTFVEWNPPPENPLISPDLVKTFPHVRAIVVDAEVHARLCTADNLDFMLNHSYNCALRTSSSDFLLITSGDLFFGEQLADRIKTKGLKPGCLYRAERVNIREDIDFSTADAAILENPANIVSINTCTEPPYDKPPYTHACGDFLMVDRATMNGLRGFDEGISFARLHLDSRFCYNAMAAGLDCELLGQIFHINHGNSYMNRPNNYPGKAYDFNANLPYLNSRDWGLHTHTWHALGERLWRISSPDLERPADGLPSSEIETANAVLLRMAQAKSGRQPLQPLEHVPLDVIEIDPASIRAEDHWTGSLVEGTAAPVLITTVAAQWGYSAFLRVEIPQESQLDWSWMKLDMEGVSGQAGVSALSGNDLMNEHYINGDGRRQVVYIPMPADGEGLMFRNSGAEGPAQLRVHAITLLRQARVQMSFDHLLLPNEAH